MTKHRSKIVYTAFLFAAGVLVAGCSTLQRATLTPQVQTLTPPVVVTNLVWKTNAVVVAAHFDPANMVNYPAATNLVPVQSAVLTTNPAVVVTNWVPSPIAQSSITAAGAVVNTFAPGVGTVVSLVGSGLLTLFAGWQNRRQKRFSVATVQGIEAFRQALKSTEQGTAWDAKLTNVLMRYHLDANVGGVAKDLVDEYTGFSA